MSIIRNLEGGWYIFPKLMHKSGLLKPFPPLLFFSRDWTPENPSAVACDLRFNSLFRRDLQSTASREPPASCRTLPFAAAAKKEPAVLLPIAFALFPATLLLPAVCTALLPSFPVHLFSSSLFSVIFPASLQADRRCLWQLWALHRVGCFPAIIKNSHHRPCFLPFSGKSSCYLFPVGRLEPIEPIVAVFSSLHRLLTAPRFPEVVEHFSGDLLLVLRQSSAPLLSVMFRRLKPQPCMRVLLVL